MRAFLCLAVVVTIGLAPLARGDAPAPKAVAEQPVVTVSQLIEQLASKDFHVRQNATRAITALGPTALPALQKARAHPDAEVRRRLEEIIVPIERAIALTPKLVTLHADKKIIKDVIADLAKASGYKIAIQEGQGTAAPTKTSYTFHFDKVLFWEVFDKICEESGLILQQNGTDDTLRLTFQNSYVPFRCYNGSFKVIATGFNYHRSNNFGQFPRNPGFQGNQGWENLQLNLSVGVEPRLPLIKLGQARVTVAEDDEKHSLTVGDGNWNGWWWGGRQWWGGGNQRIFFMATNVSLMSASRTAKTVKIVKGFVPVTLLAETKPVVVTDKIQSAKGKKIKVGSATFNIEDVTVAANKQITIKVQFSEESKDNDYDYSRIQSIQQRLEFQDEKGNKIPCNVNFQNFQSPTSAEFTVNSQPGSNNKAGVPTKLVFHHWILMEHEVPFEFHDLPLP
jgi:hypothetical protein